MLHLSFSMMRNVNVLQDDLNHTSDVEYFNEKFADIIFGKNTQLIPKNSKHFSGYDLG